MENETKGQMEPFATEVFPSPEESKRSAQSEWALATNLHNEKPRARSVTMGKVLSPCKEQKENQGAWTSVRASQPHRLRNQSFQHPSSNFPQSQPHSNFRKSLLLEFNRFNEFLDIPPLQVPEQTFIPASPSISPPSPPSPSRSPSPSPSSLPSDSLSVSPNPSPLFNTFPTSPNTTTPSPQLLPSPMTSPSPPPTPTPKEEKFPSNSTSSYAKSHGGQGFMAFMPPSSDELPPQRASSPSPPPPPSSPQPPHKFSFGKSIKQLKDRGSKTNFFNSTRSSLDLRDISRSSTPSNLFDAGDEEAPRDLMIECMVGQEFLSKIGEKVQSPWEMKSYLENAKYTGKLFLKYIVALFPSVSLRGAQIYINVTQYFFGLCCLNIMGGDDYTEIKTTNLNDFLWEDTSLFYLNSWSKVLLSSIFNKIGQTFRRTLSFYEVEKFGLILTEYIGYLEKRDEKWHPKFREIAQDHLSYLDSHRNDPCNYILGTIPSPFFVEKYLREAKEVDGSSILPEQEILQQKLERWRCFQNCPERIIEEIDEILTDEQEKNFLVGEIVALEIEHANLPRGWFCSGNWKEDFWEFAFCRVAKIFDDSLLVYIDPFETIPISVERSSVRKILEYSSNPIFTEKDSSNVMLFSNPLFPWEKEVQTTIRESVIDTLISNGFIVNRDEEKMNLLDLTTLSSEEKLLVKLSGPSFEGVFSIILRQLHHRIPEWLESLPIGLFAPPHLNAALHEIKLYFTKKIKQSIKRELKMHWGKTAKKFKELNDFLRSILNGSRKQEICGHWLKVIEQTVDKFLEERGFSHNVIPYNYLNCVLTDEQKGIIQKNLKILEGVLSEGPGGELDKNILSTIRSVYKIIGPFVRELEMTIELFHHWKTPANEEEFERIFINLEKDLKYLERMKEMDDEIQDLLEQGDAQPKKFEMTSTVPVSGLFMARIHIYQSECVSVLETNTKQWEMGKVTSD